ncbi:hypothetical protein [Streptomyces chartreusis]|uniref:Uncharacterized protein n=1 Tax=Streptomyces chartreusis TaxID=1969 RepID=A0A7H8T8U8_STRCX|nr:hypothetical protein [Streptomyces chartreusis]QKZ18360.1 hypothetical protein HUT05_13910 [Streptomyces chartreusis]
MKVDVTGNDRSRIYVAAGSITMTERPLLPTDDIPAAELDVVRDAWVALGPHDDSVLTAEDAARKLNGDGLGLAVIAGPVGYGKRTAGIRALWDASRSEIVTTGKALSLKEIRPDWGTPDAPDSEVVVPDTELLPDEAGTAYLLDVAAEISAWRNPARVAQALLTHAGKLRQVGSRLVVIADEHSWPEGVNGALSNVVVRAKVRPSAHRVARAHLEYIHRHPDRLRWLNTATISGHQVGEAAHLLTDDSSPADATRLAVALSAVDEEVPGSLATALDAFQQWRTDVDTVFKSTRENPDDRALLIATVFLSGADALTIQEAARSLLDEPQETKVRTILTGPDLTTRFQDVKAQVEGRTVTLDHRPGYARAVLLHLWQQRADIHRPLLNWVDKITRPKQPGATRLTGVGDLLVHLAIAENDIRVIEQIHAWTGNGDNSTEHRELIARVLTTAAEADALGASVRAKLLTWAQDESEAVASVVALVCGSRFADHYPAMALVRLRHVLDRANADLAVHAAQQALCGIALREQHLPRVWSTVSKWAVDKQHLAGHRAFLTLLDPREDPTVLQILLAAAERDAEIKEAIVSGWSAALVDPRVHGECEQILVAWAHARAGGQVPYELITDILDQIVVRHLSSTPIAALVFGEPGVAYDEPVIALRKDLRRASQLPDAAFGDDVLEP